MGVDVGLPGPTSRRHLTETAAAHDDELARAVADGVDVRRYYACVTRHPESAA